MRSVSKYAKRVLLLLLAVSVLVVGSPSAVASTALPKPRNPKIIKRFVIWVTDILSVPIP